MAAETLRLSGMKAKLTYAGRYFHAWWEGYAFNDMAERAAIAAHYPGPAAGAAQPFESVAQLIWGEGRLEPGSPAWTMRFARLLSLPVKANVVVFGAGAGAPLSDLRHGTKWKLAGFTRASIAGSRDLKSYDDTFRKLHDANAAGALSFFELSADADPAAFARIVGERLLPGAKAVFVDFTVARKGARLRHCFPSAMKGTARTIEEYERALAAAGFTIGAKVDETATFLPLVTQGWSGWRRAYELIKRFENTRQRAQLARYMGAHAHLWAERFEAMKSGQLRVTRIQATRD